MGTYLFGNGLGITRLDKPKTKRRKAKKEKLPKGMKRASFCRTHHACVCYFAEFNRLREQLNYFRDPREDLLLRLAPVSSFLKRAIANLNAAALCLSDVVERLTPDDYSAPKKKKRQAQRKEPF